METKSPTNMDQHIIEALEAMETAGITLFRCADLVGVAAFR